MGDNDEDDEEDEQFKYSLIIHLYKIIIDPKWGVGHSNQRPTKGIKPQIPH